MAFDTDSQAYFTAVEDVSDFDLTAIESWLTADYVKGHIDAYVRGLKKDGVWSAMLHTGLLIGPRTLSGTYKQLRGVSDLTPSQPDWGYNPREGIERTVTGWINTGQQSGGSQNDSHQWVWIPNTYMTGTGRYIASSDASHIIGAVRFRASSSTLNTVASSFSNGMAGWSRNNSANYNYIAGESSGVFTQASTSTISDNTVLFAQNESGASSAVLGAKISAYGTGTHVDLTKVRDRFAALRAALYNETVVPGGAKKRIITSYFYQQSCS